MSNDELLDRLHRIHAAIDATIEGDLSKFPPTVVSDERGFKMYQDFLGGLTDAQITNLAHGLIHNIANVPDHLRRWCRKNGHDPKRIDQLIQTCFHLQVSIDLSNNDKHGYPPRDKGFSGVAPRLDGARRAMQMTTRAEAGSSVAMVWTGRGFQVVGDGSSAVVITGTVVDAQGTALGDLRDICVDALACLEGELRALGILKRNSDT